MVKLNKIYTRTGDSGQTGLGDGSRRAKHDLRVETYGSVDETNAVIGLARLHTKGESDVMLGRIQDDLFDLGADLCVPECVPEGAPKKSGEALRLTQAQVERLESEIDALNANLEPLSSFILPGGSPASAHLHHARTVARRAERLLCALVEAEKVNAHTLIYLNRLSDHLFVLARVLNEGGKADILWRPGANR